MNVHRIGPSLPLRASVRRMVCLVAVALLLVFAAAVGAAPPQAAGVIGTITSGSAVGHPPSPYGYSIPGYTDGITCDGIYGCPFAAPPFGFGTTYVRGNLYCGLYTCGTVQTIQR